MNDFTDQAEKSGLELEEYLEIVELFLETTRESLERMRGAITERDMRGIVETAHSIKGAAGNLRFGEIYGMAREIEERARGGNMDRAYDSARAIEEECHAIAETLLSYRSDLALG